MDSTVSTQIKVPFHGEQLFVVAHMGQPYTPMKPIVEGMGLDWKSQHAKLSHSRYCMVEITMQVPDGSQRRAVSCIPLRKLAGWMMSIHANKVRTEIKDKVLTYQNECDDVLWDYWTKGEIANPNFRAEKTRKALPNGLSIEQQDAIKQLVKARAETLPEEKRAGATIKLWSSIKSKFRVGYKELPPENFTEALSLVARLPLEGELVEEAAPPMLQRFVISRREASNLHCLFTHVRSISGFINQVVPMLRMAESPLAGRYQGIFSDLNFAADLLGDLRDRCKAEYQATMVA